MVMMSLTQREADLIRDLRLVEQAHGSAHMVTIVGDDEIVELIEGMVQMARQAQECSFDGDLCGLVVKLPRSASLRSEQYLSVVGLLSRWYADTDVNSLPNDDGLDVDTGVEA